MPFPSHFRIEPGIEKIAVLRANALGDFIFALPALTALRLAYPKAEIVLLARSWHQQFLSQRPSPVDRVVVIPEGGIGNELPERQDAIAIDWQGYVPDVRLWFLTTQSPTFNESRWNGNGSYLLVQQFDYGKGNDSDVSSPSYFMAACLSVCGVDCTRDACEHSDSFVNDVFTQEVIDSALDLLNMRRHLVKN